MPLIKDGAEIEDEWVIVEAQPDNPPPQAGEDKTALSLSIWSLHPKRHQDVLGAFVAGVEDECGAGRIVE